MSYSDKYINLFKNCLKSTDDKYIGGGRKSSTFFTSNSKE